VKQGDLGGYASEKQNIQVYKVKAPTPPQTKSYGWQTTISQLKRAATKTQGFSMIKGNTPLETKANHKLLLEPNHMDGKSNQKPNSTKDADSP
jgi:hypothetical protein